MSIRAEKGRALFYTRDSGGKHETTPSEYVGWAQRKSSEIGLSFEGTPEIIQAMIRDSRSVSGDIFLDYGVSGNILSRNGLDNLIKTAVEDPCISHVLIPKRNRLARPDHPMDGVKLEDTLRRHGITIVFMDKTLLPLPRGERPNIGELIVATIDYDRSSEDRRELAQKVLYAQLHLAKSGFSTGGRPPYGFRRWLATEDGTPVRELDEGECVRKRGHHVVWLPGPESERMVIQRILQMLETTPASRVAAILTDEKVPTPDHGRYRIDNGVRHRTSGTWHQPTINSIAYNPLLLAMVSYGRRSMGDQLRATPNGPRILEDTDFREDAGKPKVVQNPKSSQITAPARFEPLVEPERHRKLLEKLDNRGKTQRGKPRSPDPDQNPLGCRVFDMNCGWPMYRTPYGKSFRYKCGLYQQSHGAKCAHNNVEGLVATRFVLSCIRQRALSTDRLQKLEKRIRQLAAAERHDTQLKSEVAAKRFELDGLLTERDLASKNLARAKSDEQYEALARVFDEFSASVKRIESEIAAAERQAASADDAESAVETAMEIIHRLTELAGAGEDVSAARQIFDLLNARLFLSYQQVKPKKRVLNKIRGGVVTFGDAPPPIELYEGPTGRRKIKGPATSVAAGPGECSLASPPESRSNSGREDKSLGNVNRGEWI